MLLVMEQPPRCLGPDGKVLKFDIRDKVGILFEIFIFFYTLKLCLMILKALNVPGYHQVCGYRLCFSSSTVISTFQFLNNIFMFRLRHIKAF